MQTNCVEQVETTLREMGLLRRDEAVGPYFSSHTRRGGHISDDHEPFLEKGVDSMSFFV